ncbi:Multifunctional non-homologous end joining DNA repair protein LigD [subsurface metagenome]
MAIFVLSQYSGLKTAFRHNLRLERDGGFQCWGLYKGIPEKPGVRRVAVSSAERNLLDGMFEGKISSGPYAGAKVKILDMGTYETKSWSHTKREVILHGKKLHGEYILRWMDKMYCWLLWKAPIED